MSLLFLLTLLAAIGSGLMAGLFFAFSTFVMQALGKRPAPVGIAAMQSINQTILNPVFFALFFGTALLGLGLGVLAVLDWSAAGAGWRIAGAASYLLGAIGVTLAGNVPLNSRLAALVPDSDEGATFWRRYLTDWTRLNHLRTTACTGATTGFILGMP